MAMMAAQKLHTSKNAAKTSRGVTLNANRLQDDDDDDEDEDEEKEEDDDEEDEDEDEDKDEDEDEDAQDNDNEEGADDGNGDDGDADDGEDDAFGVEHDSVCVSPLDSSELTDHKQRATSRHVETEDKVSSFHMPTPLLIFGFSITHRTSMFLMTIMQRTRNLAHRHRLAWLQCSKITRMLKPVLMKVMISSLAVNITRKLRRMLTLLSRHRLAFTRQNGKISSKSAK